MNVAVIEHTDRWLITSYGNGEAYYMIDKSTNDGGIFVQGDDATAFNVELASITAAYITLGTLYYNNTWNWCLEQLYNEYVTEGTS